ncbi:hypothetical protein [Mucilaginibacter sp. HD30]
MEEQQYISGFNRGYLIAKHEPDLAAKLAATPNQENPFFSGLIDGKEQYEMEVREWTKGFSRGTPAKDDRDIHKER